MTLCGYNITPEVEAALSVLIPAWLLMNECIIVA